MTPEEIENEVKKEEELLESMLHPVSEEKPVGEDIREDPSPTSPYYSIKDARNSARAAERSNMFDGDSTEADIHWKKVASLAPDILRNNAKDLEVASWYTEARVRIDGFTGLLYSFKLIHGLIEKYWDNLYPLPDEYGIETRVSPLSGLNGEGSDGVLIPPLRNMDITEGEYPGPFSFWQYQQAAELKHITDDDERLAKADKLGFNMEGFNKSVASSSSEFFVYTRDSVSKAIDIYRDTARLLDEYCGTEDSPPTSNITSILEECLGAIKYVGTEAKKFPAEVVTEPESTTSNSGDTSSSAPTSQPVQATGPVKSREDAFTKITEIASFFRKTEPHSPISYILERAVVWGEMSLEELMKELITDESARGAYGSLTGINTQEED
ncbi:MAG TPA: type VI secretion system protein TssA [Gammaproteobacteria bacterium]|nr:type VI secretion system protein TssA [Gammaproteobacteria bacterium]